VKLAERDTAVTILSVGPPVCRMSKRLNISYNSFHFLLDQSFSFFETKFCYKNFVTKFRPAYNTALNINEVQKFEELLSVFRCY